MRTALLMLVLIACAPGSTSAVEHHLPYPVLDLFSVRKGDDPAWAAPALEDSGWQQTKQWQIDPQGRVLWVRAHVTLPPGFDSATEPFGIFISAAASYEVFWNGALVGRNGMPGASREKETPGLLDASFHVPRELLREGNHVLALRMSSFHLRRNLTVPTQWIRLAPFGDARTQVLHAYYLSLCAVGALLLGAFYFAAMYFSNRRDVSSALLALLSLSVLSQLAAETFRLLFPYPYPWHLLRLELILGLASLSGALLVAYVAYRYAYRFRHMLILAACGAILACILLVPSYDGKTTLAVIAAIVVSLVSALLGVRDRKKGAVSVAGFLVAFIALALADFSSFIDSYYYAAATLFLLFLFAQQVQSLRRTERERDEAALRLARLELELVKKQIQPHFLMNTLTALSELIESQPKEAVAMIDALADEFRTLSGMAGQTTVAVRQELELCRHHLRVLGFRQGASFELRTQDVDPEAQVPPALFHTLIENALTHNRYSGNVIFRLEQLPGPAGARIYRLRTPLVSEYGAGVHAGQGHAYVRARLGEAFAADWLFSSAASEHEWLDEIRIGRSA